MPETEALIVPVVSVEEHEATRAWQAVAGRHATVSGIDRLNETRKTRVYRLHLAKGSVRSVIARWKPYADRWERVVYESVLPSAGLPSLAIYGELSSAEDASYWLFVEDAGEIRCRAASPHARTVAARWLARLHSWDGLIQFAAQLPRCGADYFLGHLRSAREEIVRSLGEGWIPEASGQVLSRLVGQLDEMENGWDEVQDLCAQAPMVLVHGDFAEKNTRMRRGSTGEELIVFDWETSGIGVPSVDLAQSTLYSVTPDLNQYISALRNLRPEITFAFVHKLAAVGAVFRLLAALDWQTCSLPDPTSLPSLERFEEWLGESAIEMWKHTIRDTRAL
jgi:phosphotransferase family enzyme